MIWEFLPSQETDLRPALRPLRRGSFCLLQAPRTLYLYTVPAEVCRGCTPNDSCLAMDPDIAQTQRCDENRSPNERQPRSDKTALRNTKRMFHNPGRPVQSNPSDDGFPLCGGSKSQPSKASVQTPKLRMSCNRDKDSSGHSGTTQPLVGLTPRRADSLDGQHGLETSETLQKNPCFANPFYTTTPAQPFFYMVKLKANGP